jgi:ubiquinone/menaquinone biosynthesis C-methylase UbiE
MTEIDLLIDFHKDAERQGPGSNEETIKALGFTDLEKKDHLKVADIGCGSGAQTISLAQHLNADIVAVDLFPEFLDKLSINSKKLGIQDKISTLQKSMDDLPFENEEFDLIWSEGAVYIIGFEEGVKGWKKYLKPGGYIATASNKMKVLEDNGFSPVGYFYLSESSWINNYYRPIEERFDSFLLKHNNSELAKAIIEAEKEEIRKYSLYKDYLSYGFYVARKVK